MKPNITLRQYQDRFWELVRVCLVDGFGAPAQAAGALCESLRVEATGVQYVKRWKDLDILYHDEPLYIAFDLAVSRFDMPAGGGPDAWREEHDFDYARISDEVFSGCYEPASAPEASLA